MVDQRLGEDAPRRVAGAQEQHVIDPVLHYAIPRTGSFAGAIGAMDTRRLLQVCVSR
jgi:hypothetical protein